jgi:hypothetical protein
MPSALRTMANGSPPHDFTSALRMLSDECLIRRVGDDTCGHPIGGEDHDAGLAIGHLLLQKMRIAKCLYRAK